MKVEAKRGAPTVDAVRRALTAELAGGPADDNRLSAVLRRAGDLLHRAVLEDGRECRRADARDELLRALVPIMPWAELDPRRDLFGMVAENAHALVAADLVPDSVLGEIVRLVAAVDVPEPAAAPAGIADAPGEIDMAGELLRECGLGVTVRSVRVLAERSGATSLLCRARRPDGREDAIVVRRYPHGADPYARLREYRMMHYVHRHGGPAAAPLWVSPQGTEHAGSLLVSRTDWEDGYGDALCSERPLGRDAAAKLAVALGRLHTVEIDTVPRTTVPWMRTPAEIEYAVLEAGRRVQACDPTGGRLPHSLPALVFAWLRVNLPERVSEPVLLHGRSGVRWLFAGPGTCPVALDWQGARVGEAAQDLAAVHRIIPPEIWDEFLAAYCAAGGKMPSKSRLRYYAVWHAFCRHVEAYRGMVRLLSPRGTLDDATRGLREAPAELAECIRVAFGGR
jgi:aminoglycoside phosphotransferase (APT) family kinase protein